MKLIKWALVILFSGLPLATSASSLLEMDHSKPQLRDDKFYKEYWEQHFLFEDGTFVTSQFLVANFPWPVGKDHGIMVSTVVSPDGKRMIIKNGRDLGKWNFSQDKFDLFIHTHRIKDDGGIHDTHIGNENGHLIDVRGKSQNAPLDHSRFEKGKNFMESSFYLPYFEGEGSWKVQYEKEQPFLTGTGKVQGFGTHVMLNGRLKDLLKNWLRVSGLQGQGGQPQPFLSVIERPNGEKDIVFSLKKSDGRLITFSNVTLKYEDVKKGDKKSSYPTRIILSAQEGAEKVTGTIRLNRKIDHFNINDHLNFFEKGFASSRASVANYRYIADYDIVYSTATGSQSLTGKALSEYQDIIPPKKKKKSKKRR